MRYSARVVVLVVATGSVLGTGAAASGATLARQVPPSGTLELVQRGGDVRFRHIDNPPLGSTPEAPSPGDMAIVRGVVRDTANRRVGRLRATFIRLAGQRRHVDRIDAVFSVAGGTIVVAGLSDGGADNLAVTGGTGRYAGARGTLRVTPARTGVRFRFAFA